MSTGSFNRILDDCIDRVNSGESVDACLSRYPEWAAELRPLLGTFVLFTSAADAVPSHEAMSAARIRMQQARGRRPRSAPSPGIVERLLSRPLAFAAATSVAVVALVVTLLLPLLDTDPQQPQIPGGDSTPQGTEESQPGSTDGSTDTAEPAESTGAIPAVPREEGNFVFLLSDQPNDISDFDSLVITVSSVLLKPEEPGAWVELTPQQQTADLAQLQGDRALEVWRGDIPEGRYRTVNLYVASIEGTLADTGQAADVTLPSDRLRIDASFTVASDESATEFIFDITVHRAGQSGDAPRYILSPQASESGAGKHYIAVSPPESAAHGSDDNESAAKGKGREDHSSAAGAAQPGKRPDLPSP